MQRHQCSLRKRLDCISLHHVVTAGTLKKSFEDNGQHLFTWMALYNAYKPGTLVLYLMWKELNLRMNWKKCFFFSVGNYVTVWKFSFSQNKAHIISSYPLMSVWREERGCDDVLLGRINTVICFKFIHIWQLIWSFDRGWILKTPRRFETKPVLY